MAEQGDRLRLGDQMAQALFEAGRIVLAIQAFPAARRGYKQGAAGFHDADDES